MGLVCSKIGYYLVIGGSQPLTGGEWIYENQSVLSSLWGGKTRKGELLGKCEGLLGARGPVGGLRGLERLKGGVDASHFRRRPHATPACVICPTLSNLFIFAMKFYDCFFSSISFSVKAHGPFPSLEFP